MNLPYVIQHYADFEYASTRPVPFPLLVCKLLLADGLIILAAVCTGGWVCVYGAESTKALHL